MGLQLPGELVSVLGALGFSWPEADETKLFEMGNAWIGFGQTLSGGVGQADATAAEVWTQGSGMSVDAFKTAWTGAESPTANLGDAATAATMVGAGLFVVAGLVLALKINVIIQVTILAIQIAQAIATAVVTFGASLLEIPIFRMLTKLVLDQLLGLAIDAVLNG
ncbi:WXG100-like domain-containing protein [Catenuloplanes atrovinosus]|uniref:Outer membrane channel protein CpnT-like N-terminal domain-containing protein n=1 Tax=Catenuloplanes atrovinosus TaxID=137266 RepID=A0AAE3YUN5_9ACTN|nr:hypothetical protein [Catenuloplanes atrovinosus]MDR7278986.1 hypothetical protein [Catenuloplanes atrovinosus]